MPQVTQLALLILLLPEPRKRQRLCCLLEASRLRHQGLCGQRPALPGRNGNGRLLWGLHRGRHGGHEVIGPLGLQGQMLEGWVLRLKHGETQKSDDFFWTGVEYDLKKCYCRMICVSFVSVICVMVNKLILMNSIEWTPCVSAVTVSCKYVLQYEGKLIFDDFCKSTYSRLIVNIYVKLFAKWSQASCRRNCDCAELSHARRRDRVYLHRGQHGTWSAGSMNASLSFWVLFTISTLWDAKNHRILKCSSTYPSINPLDTTNHSQTNLYPAMQREANMAAVQAMPLLSSVISIGNG